MSSVPPPPPPPPGFQPVDPWQPVPRNDNLAIASLVCGVSGFVCIVPAIVAIVLGVQARGRIDRSDGALTGRGMATAGIVLGVMWVVITVLVAVATLGGDGTSF